MLLVRRNGGGPSLLRSSLERLSRNRVLRRRLPREFASAVLYVTPGASLRFWRRGLASADPMLLRVVREFVSEGEVVWDIGANVGLFTVPAAVKAGSRGRVLAVEPDIWLASLLCRTKEANLGKGVDFDVLCSALSDRVGIAQLNIAQRGRASNYLEGTAGSTQSGGARMLQAVTTLTLDWLMDHYDPPSFVKIDVEGGELPVLRGAERVLEHARPKLLLECSASREALTAILRRHGYRLYDAHAQALEAPLKTVAYDTLALPE